MALLDFPGGPVVKDPLANAGDMGLISGPGRPHALQLLKTAFPRAHASQEKPHS